MRSKSEICYVPTYTEGLSNSLIEAMASGLPCITTNVTSMPDIITNENLGILVENKNVIQLSDAILDLVKNRNKRVAIGENARLHITTNFTTEKVVEAFTNIFI